MSRRRQRRSIGSSALAAWSRYAATATCSTSIYVDPKFKAFDDLKVGDVVTVRYTESVIVAVRPNAKLTPLQDTTEEARRAGGDTVVQQQKVVVTIENIDSQRLFVTYRTHDNQRGMRAVIDKALLEGLRVGDRVEVTLTTARAVSIERGRRYYALAGDLSNEAAV